MQTGKTYRIQTWHAMAVMFLSAIVQALLSTVLREPLDSDAARSGGQPLSFNHNPRCTGPPKHHLRRLLLSLRGSSRLMVIRFKTLSYTAQPPLCGTSAPCSPTRSGYSGNPSGCCSSCTFSDSCWAGCSRGFAARSPLYAGSQASPVPPYVASRRYQIMC